MGRKSSIARAYSSFFIVASFFAEGTMAVPDALRARQGTSASTNTSPASLNFTSFGITKQEGLTTCQTLQITWTFSGGPIVPITIEATDDGVQQNPQYGGGTGNVPRAVPTGVQNPLPVITVAIATAISPQASLYTWPAINVPQGRYVLQAKFSDALSQSYLSYSFPFFVQNGRDISCLSPTSPSPTQSGTSQLAAAPTLSSPSTALPVGAASSSSTDSAGLIAGVSAAGAILLGLAIAGWVWIYRRRRQAGIKGGPTPQSFRRWNGLGSTDSRGGLIGTNGPSTHPRGESIGTLPMSPSEEAVAKSEKTSTHSKFGDANPFQDGSGQTMALSTLPVLRHHESALERSVGVTRSYSVASSVSNHHDYAMTNELGASHNDNGGRRPSVGESYHTGRQSIESVTYPPSSPSSPRGMGRDSTMYTPSPMMSRPESIITATTHQNHTGFLSSGPQSVSSHAGLLNDRNLSPSPLFDHSTAPTSPTSSCDPSKSGAGGNRRSLAPTKRKPVPAYDADFEVCTSPVTTAMPPSSTSSTPIPPSSPVGEYTSMPHYVTRSQAGHDQSQPNLVHKSSFGPGGLEGKAVHYLIPDPPMAPSNK